MNLSNAGGFIVCELQGILNDIFRYGILIILIESQQTNYQLI